MSEEITEREHNTDLWCLVKLEEMVREGKIDGFPGSNNYRLTPKAIAEYDQMTAAGFEPTHDEIQKTMSFLVQVTPALLDEVFEELSEDD